MAAAGMVKLGRAGKNILLRLHQNVSCPPNTRTLSSGLTKRGESEDGGRSECRDPGPVFLDERVQYFLSKVTGFNIDKIFRRRPKSELEPPQYRLLTDEELVEEQSVAIARARKRLQMPPVMKPRDDTFEIISNDEDIAGHSSVKYVFTDITFGLKDRERTMVVREQNGVLRTATPEERDRLQLIYLPPEGRMHRQPQMLEGEELERLLEEGRYEYVLDRACVQFEPDDPEYIRVTQRTYEHVDGCQAYDSLWSTRHYGVMTFYLAFYSKLDGLLLHKIQQHELHDAADLVRLFHVIHPHSPSKAATTENSDDLDLLQHYTTLEARRKAELELAVQSFMTSRARTASSTSPRSPPHL